MNYQEQLRDPRWQKKRLEVMERDEWTCQTCYDTEATLSVHHRSYRQVDGRFAAPWDYPEGDLVTICSDCHTAEEEYLKRRLPKESAQFFRELCCDSDAIMSVMSVLKFLKEKDNNGKRLFGPFVFRLLCPATEEKEYYSWLKTQGGNNV